MISLSRLIFCPIDTRPCRHAEWLHNCALFTLTRLNAMLHATRFIAPAIHRVMNGYPDGTCYRPPVLYLLLKLSVKLHSEAGEQFTHSVLHFLHSFVSPRFYCIDRHQHHCRLFVGVAYWPNQSGNNCRCTHILLLYTFRILNITGRVRCR